MIPASHPARQDAPGSVTPPSIAGPRLFTLGRVSLAGEDRAELLGPGKPLAVLTFLRSIPGQTATREHLIDLLWADSDPRLGRQALRQVLLRLRQALGNELFDSRHDEVTLKAPLWHDRDCFLGNVARGELDAAFALYQGAFFPGFGSAGSLQFEHWADAERAHLQGLFLRTGDTLVRRKLEEDPREALRIARLLHREAPESEAAWRLLLQAALSAHELLQAHTEADAMERWLREAGRRPEPATAALLRTVRDEATTTDASRSGTALTAELVGREREFSALLDAWKEVCRGTARLLHLEAQAGHGKSRLLADASLRLRSMGATVILVPAHQGEQEMRYSLAASAVRLLAELPGVTGIAPAFAGALLGLHPGLAARFPGATPPAAGADLLHQRSTALAELLSAVAEERPLALFIDDLHWTDAESRQVLAGAVNRLGAARVLVVTAGRPGVTGAALLPACTVQRLDPLTSRNCEALVEALAVPPAPDWAPRLGAAVWRASRGSPLLALETLQLALERGDLAIRQGVWWADDIEAAAGRLEADDPLGARLATLTPDEHRLLVTLAIAASPLRLDALDAALGANGIAGPLLSSLEVRGYVACAETGWITGHDEIATAVLHDISQAAQQQVRATLGRALLTLARGDIAQLTRAIRLLAAGGDEAALGTALRRALPIARAGGDAGSACEITAELVLAPADSERVRRLVRALPFGMRSPVRPAMLAGAVGGGALLALALLAPWRPAPPPPDIELMIPHGSPVGQTMMSATPLRLAEWDRTQPIEPAMGHDLQVATGERRYDRIAISPDGQRVAFTRITADSGLTDIYLQERDGTVHRLTDASGDDFQPGWSPDGRYIVFSTARWTPIGNKDADLAVLEVATGRVRQLTHGSDADQISAWSPDGTRIAFIRTLASGARRELCWVAFAGGSPRCRPEVAGTVADLAGWDGPGDVLVVRQDSAGGISSLARMAVDGERILPVDSRPTSTAVASPDGRWIAAIQLDADTVRSWLRVFPTKYPDLARTVYPEGDEALVGGAAWRAAGTESPRYLDTLRVLPPVAMPVVGVPHGLRVEGKSVDGSGVALPAAVTSWQSSDRSVATVDSVTGLLTPHRPGTVRVTVTAGGWRTATVDLQIGRSVSQPLDSVRWTAAEWNGWIPFGRPVPTREVLPERGSVLLTNGDENFESGVVSRRRYPVARGLGIEALVSLPIEQPKWQQLKLGLATDPVPLLDGLKFNSSCLMAFPAGEGSAYLDQLQLGSPRESHLVPGLSRFRDGAWHRLRIEVRPDGSCAFEADGEVLWRSSIGFVAVDSVALFFLGHSVDARIMVGPVQVWRGVRLPDRGGSGSSARR